MRRLLKSKAIFQIFLVITLAFFTANIITKDVKAQTDEGENCCRDLGNEQYCQGINNPDGCAEGYVPTSCEYVNGCEQGCCNLIEKGAGKEESGLMINYAGMIRNACLDAALLEAIKLT